MKAAATRTAIVSSSSTPLSLAGQTLSLSLSLSSTTGSSREHRDQAPPLCALTGSREEERNSHPLLKGEMKSEREAVAKNQGVFSPHFSTLCYRTAQAISTVLAFFRPSRISPSLSSPSLSFSLTSPDNTRMATKGAMGEKNTAIALVFQQNPST